MSINTHSTIPHCKSMLGTRPINNCTLDSAATPQPARSAPVESCAARHGLPTTLMKDRPMELVLIILLLVVLFGGGFGFYRGGYYRQGGPVGIGGILGLILVVLVIGWLVHGHIGSLYL
jgi:hypothetical protein